MSVHQLPAQFAPVCVQSLFVLHGSPTCPLDVAQTKPEPPRFL
jgi:hypothetical protein